MSRLKELYAQPPGTDFPLSPAQGARLVAIAKQFGDEEVQEMFDRVRELAEIRSNPERDDWEQMTSSRRSTTLRSSCTLFLIAHFILNLQDWLATAAKCGIELHLL